MSHARSTQIGPEHRPTGAVIATRRPLLSAWLLALIPVAFVVFGQVLAQLSHLDDAGSYYVTAMLIAMAAVIGVMVVSRSHLSFTEFGFRAPRLHRGLLWFLPLVAVVVVSALGSGFTVHRSMVLPLVLMALAAAFSEEIWFRGFLLAVLRARGSRYAVVWSAVIFAVLHLANALASKSPTYLVLQALFALVFGLVAAQVVVLSGSLWPVIAWHFAWDAVNYLGGDHITSRGLAALAVVVVALAGYGLVLWRQIPATGRVQQEA